MTDHTKHGHICDTCRPKRAANSILTGPTVGRRDFFKLAGAGLTGYFLMPVLGGEAAAAIPGLASGASLIGKARNCIFILMTGAPSQLDTFDLKVGEWTPGDFNPTSYNGVMFPQGLMPKLADRMNRFAIMRSMRAPALVHPLQQTWAQIARSPTSALGKVAPNIGSVVALEFEPQRKSHQKMPVFVSLNTGGAVVGSGYFNGLYSPFDIIADPLGLDSLSNSDGQTTFENRYSVLQSIDTGLRTNSPLGTDVSTMGSFYDRAKNMMFDPQIDAAFKFTTEEQQRYGQSTFGNGCIVARNMLQGDFGTRFIQLNFGGWDHHDLIYDRTQGIYPLAADLDNGFSTLLDDLASSPGINGGTLLDETLIVAMGEFGRTPGRLTGQEGRDHYFQHFAVFAGGGVSGGKVIGTTTADGIDVDEPGWSQNRPASYEDVAATIYSALGIDYLKILNNDPFGRGFEYIPFANEGAWYPINELFSRSLQPRPGLSPRDGGGRRIS